MNRTRNRYFLQKCASTIHLPWRWPSLVCNILLDECFYGFHDEDVLITGIWKQEIINPSVNIQYKEKTREPKCKILTCNTKMTGIHNFPVWLGFGPSINFLSTWIDSLPFNATSVIVWTNWGIHVVPFGRTCCQEKHTQRSS